MMIENQNTLIRLENIRMIFLLILLTSVIKYYKAKKNVILILSCNHGKTAS